MQGMVRPVVRLVEVTDTPSLEATPARCEGVGREEDGVRVCVCVGWIHQMRWSTTGTGGSAVCAAEQAELNAVLALMEASARGSERVLLLCRVCEYPSRTSNPCSLVSSFRSRRGLYTPYTPLSPSSLCRP